MRNPASTALVLLALASLLFFASCRRKKEEFSILKTPQAPLTAAPWQAQAPPEIEECRRMYLRAAALEEAKKFAAAADLFRSLDGRYPAAHDFVLFHLALIAREIPDESRVMARLKTLLKSYPTSPLAPAAAYELARSSLRAGEKDAARRYFTELRAAHPTSPQAVGALYYLGELLASSEPKEAATSLRQYLSNAPDGTYGVAAAKSLSSLAGRSLSADDRRRIGLAYYHAGEYGNALEHLKRAVSRETWLPLAQCRVKLGMGAQALQTFELGLKLGGSDDDVHRAMDAIVRLKGRSRAAATWSALAARFPRYGDYALYVKTYPITASAALPIFEKILRGWPDGMYAPEASWNVMWALIRTGKLTDAYARGAAHLERYPRSKSAPAALYWMAKVLERTSQGAEAATLYHRVLKEYPDSYYAFRAEGRLRQIEGGERDPLWTLDGDGAAFPAQWSPPPPMALTEVAQKYGGSLAEVMHLGRWKDVRSALEGRSDPLMEAYIKAWEGRHDEAIVVMRDKAGESLAGPLEESPAWRLLYPMYYCDKMKREAERFGVNPYIAQALAREESYFNSKAKSYADAMGLMQLLPGTARDVARWVGLEPFAPDMLFQAGVNVTLGVRYLKSTFDHFGGEALFGVAAYNAGPGAVSRWKSAFAGGDMDYFVENIPYDQTREYVRKVFRSYWCYRKIYAGAGN